MIPASCHAHALSVARCLTSSRKPETFIAAFLAIAVSVWPLACQGMHWHRRFAFASSELQHPASDFMTLHDFWVCRFGLGTSMAELHLVRRFQLHPHAQTVVNRRSMFPLRAELNDPAGLRRT